MRYTTARAVLLAATMVYTGCGDDGGGAGGTGPATALSIDAETALPASAGAAQTIEFATQFGAVLRGVFAALSSSGGAASFGVRQKIETPLPQFCPGGGSAVLDWPGCDLEAGQTVTLVLENCSGSAVSPEPASGTVGITFESVSGGIPCIGGILSATAELDLSVAPDTTITGSFAVNVNIPGSLILANVTLGARQMSDSITVSGGGQQAVLSCFDIFQRIGLAGPGIEFFRPLGIMSLANQFYTMNSYDQTPPNIGFEFSGGTFVPNSGSIGLTSGVSATAPCRGGSPAGDNSFVTATFFPGGCVELNGQDSGGVAFMRATTWNSLLDLDFTSGGGSSCGGGGTGGSGGAGGTGGSGGPVADVYADEVDDSLTDINDEDCGVNKNCIGEPANALGPPDFMQGEADTSSVTLGLGGTLGLIFVDELCVVDGDPNTPDIIVYEVGGVQVEDFSVDAAVVGGPLVGNPVVSSVSNDQLERHLDLTSVIGGAGMVERIQIIDFDGPPDEPEMPGFENGWGADIDAVACFSR